MRSRLEEKDLVFLGIATQLAHLGTCDRAQVGAVITRHGRCISWGYNGAPPGMDHCSLNKHGWQGWWDMHDTGKRTHAEMMAIISERGCRNATHAEANALGAAAREGISTDGGTLYVTVSPCETCARLLIAAGISRVVFVNEYRDASGTRVLTDAGIPTNHMS